MFRKVAEMLKRFRVKVLTHRQVSGKEFDGSDAVYSRGVERTVDIQFGKLNSLDRPSDEMARKLASRQLPRGVFATKVLTVEEIF